MMPPSRIASKFGLILPRRELDGEFNGDPGRSRGKRVQFGIAQRNSLIGLTSALLPRDISSRFTFIDGGIDG
jgi:hypothetical protein